MTPLGADLNTGLAFRPVANVVGGLLIGWGMAIAQSCVSGLLFKFGAGMLGGAVGIGGWIAGELAVRGCGCDVRFGGRCECVGMVAGEGCEASWRPAGDVVEVGGHEVAPAGGVGLCVLDQHPDGPVRYASVDTCP